MLTALDATYSVGSNLSGVGVYSRQLLFGLASRYPDSRFLACYRPHRLLRGLQDRLPSNCRRRPLFDRRLSHPRAVFHGLNQRLPAGPWKAKVATFHDLFVLTGDYSTSEFRARFAAQAREAAARADRIIAVSAFTASQVVQLLGVEPSRVRTVHHGVCPPPTLPTRSPEEKRILFVGAIQRRKNLLRLIEAFERVNSEWVLTLAGSDGFGAAEVHARALASPACGRIELPGYVSAAQLEDLYRRASVFAFPSLDEGFGMPVLEAMARGIPVVTSNCSALPEVAGDAAFLVDPFDVEELATGLCRLTGDERLRGDLASRGRLRASAFPWDAAVAATWSVYREIS